MTEALSRKILPLFPPVTLGVLHPVTTLLYSLGIAEHKGIRKYVSPKPLDKQMIISRGRGVLCTLPAPPLSHIQPGIRQGKKRNLLFLVGRFF